MPMFICTLGREAINRLHATALIATITKLATVRSQRIPQLALLRRHTRVWFMAMHRKLEPLLALRPDIAILSECAGPEVAAARAVYGAAQSHAWVGDLPT